MACFRQTRSKNRCLLRLHQSYEQIKRYTYIRNRAECNHRPMHHEVFNVMVRILQGFKINSYFCRSELFRAHNHALESAN